MVKWFYNYFKEMWPVLLDMTKEECLQFLRNLELEAHSTLVSALRAQGKLSTEKVTLLNYVCSMLHISQERHKAEIRRAVNDEKLNTIAYHISGSIDNSEDWAREGRRLVPLLPRTAPQTAYSAIADEVAESASQYNRQLPSPASTERKRQIGIQNSMVPETSKNVPFRASDFPKSEEGRKRKMTSESSSLAQHLLAPKMCKIQQIYRQRSKVKQKEMQRKAEIESQEMSHQNRSMPQPVQTPSPKINVLQNITLHPISEETFNNEIEFVQYSEQNSAMCSNENQAPRTKVINNIKPATGITIKPCVPLAGPSSEGQKNIKPAPIKKTINSGQKLIVVSNAQTISSNSILQRTLQMSPIVKNVSLKNLEKFKIVSGNSNPTTITATNSTPIPVKHKMVTVKTNSSPKKVIPLSQLQMLNPKGNYKVLPVGSKIVGKSATSSAPLLIVHSTHQLTRGSQVGQLTASSKIQNTEETRNGDNAEESRENGKSILHDVENNLDNTEIELDKKNEELYISPKSNEAEMEEWKEIETRETDPNHVEQWQYDLLTAGTNAEEEVHLYELTNTENGINIAEELETDIIIAEDIEQTLESNQEILTLECEIGGEIENDIEVDCAKSDIETN